MPEGAVCPRPGRRSEDTLIVFFHGIKADPKPRRKAENQKNSADSLINGLLPGGCQKRKPAHKHKGDAYKDHTKPNQLAKRHSVLLGNPFSVVRVECRNIAPAVRDANADAYKAQKDRKNAVHTCSSHKIK